MERYKVTVTIDGKETRLLIPMLSASPVSSLATQVKLRIGRLGIGINSTEFTLHLEQADGPILDADDLLSDVLPDPKNERLYATPSHFELGPNYPHSHQVSSL